MDGWQVAQNYIVAAAIGGAVGGYYYYTANQKKPNRTGSLNAVTSRRSDTDLRGRNVRRNTRESSEGRPTNDTPEARQTSTGAARKRKVRAENLQPRHQPSLESIADEKPTKESDMSAAQFAKQMQQARQGANLSTSKNKETRVKTVKPRASTTASVASFEDAEPPAESSYTAGGVSDMLEAVAPAPSTLRITAPVEPQQTKTPRQPKQEVVETKKQRQNRKKVEERKAQREAEEKDRKALEERQRRTAREARGEPAKNGIPVARAPVNNPWEQQNASSAAAAVQASEAVAGNAHGVMLDTFDAESTSSSNGGPGVSTAATSTTSGEQPRWDNTSEEEQMAAALKQSGYESGWTTVSVPVKKGKKKGANSELPSGAITPVREQGKQTTANGHVRTGAYAALDTNDE